MISQRIYIVKSNLYKGLDGYGIFPETIGAELNTLSQFYPLLTDGPVTQSAFVENKGTSGVAVGGLGVTTISTNFDGGCCQEVNI